MQYKESPLLGCLPINGKSSVRCWNVNIGIRYSFIFFSAFSTITVFSAAFFSLIYYGGYSSIGERLRTGQPPPFPPFLPALQYAKEYNHDTFTRLDSPFEFESPPDFTKLGIESWSECQEVRTNKGWRVEHCTAPGSTWMNVPMSQMIEDFDESNNFLFRPEPRRSPIFTPIPQKFMRSLLDLLTWRPSPRLSTPSTDYTLGSDSQAPGSRCHNNPGRPISLNETTRIYVDNFAGPDTFRAIIDGPEHYIANQQINLGNCTYALPYVLSRPGRFWLVNIERGYDDYGGMNENFNDTFIPKFIGEMILPEVGPPSQADSEAEEVQKYKEAMSQVHEFGVCAGCPQWLYPELEQKYEDWPICSQTPLIGAREYGALVRKSPAHSYEDLFKQDYEWVGSRPLCRHEPRLVTFNTPEAIQESENTNNTAVPPYGSPPMTPHNLQEKRVMTTDCVGRNRSLYFAGDSHDRQLFIDTIQRLAGKHVAANITGWDNHWRRVGGISMQQDFDTHIKWLQAKIEYLLDPGYIPFQIHDQISDDVEKAYFLQWVDTLVISFGAWAAAGFESGELWPTDRLEAYVSNTLWKLAEVRHRRREYFKETGYGYPDLVIIWVGQSPWPDTRQIPDMRTNPRLQYWDDLINSEIEKINLHYQDEGGMIDHLNIYDKFLHFRKSAPDQAHHSGKHPGDAAIQVLFHKIDICRAAFTPEFPHYS